MGIINRLVLVLSVLVSFPQSGFAYLENEKTPVCLEGGEELKVDNERILKFKRETKNQYLARGYVSGVVNTPVVRKGNHDRFIMKIGTGPKDDLEVIYNTSFGPMPQVKIGDSVTVCGDYITSNAPTERYQASPAGAIIHWVHYNPGDRASSKKHEHGFVMFGSTLVGFDGAPAGAWNGKIGGGRGQPGSVDNDNRNNNRPNTNNPQPTATPAPNQPNRGRVTPGSNPPGRVTNPPARRWRNCRSVQECRERNPGYEEDTL